ncbi:tRNA-guanine transglycosylase, partial [Arachnia propionica]|uniref:tRNA-guanine transglycosylase n=1 Tax=Arachnia propionica TaxID=1750 RepID=UPI003C6F537B
SREGRLKLRHARFTYDAAILDEGCDCPACAGGYTRAYLHHLFKAKEMLASTLATIHNERFTVRLVDEIRASLESGEFDRFRNEFMGRYNARKTR